MKKNTPFQLLSMYGFAVISLFSSVSMASAKEITLVCDIRAANTTYTKYTEFLEVEFKFDPAQVPDSHMENGGCVPQSITSGLSMDKTKFTQLEIRVSNCGNDRPDSTNPYIAAKATIGTQQIDLITALRNVGPVGLGVKTTYSRANGAAIATPRGKMAQFDLVCSRK